MNNIETILQRRDPSVEQLGLVSYEKAFPKDLELLASELSLNHSALPGVAEYAALTANNGGIHSVELREPDELNPTIDTMTVLAGMVLHIRGDFDRVNLFDAFNPSADDFKTYQATSQINALHRSRERQFTVVCSDTDRFLDDVQRKRAENLYRSLYNAASDTHKIAVLPLWVPKESPLPASSTVVAA